MSASEPYDFLSTITADYTTTTLSLKAQETFTEEGFKNQVIRLADDNSEERVTLSTGSLFYVDIPLPLLSESDAGIVHDLYHDPNKANGVGRTFKWLSHDGHTYVARFDGKLGRTAKAGILQGIPTIRLRLMGRIADA